MILAATHTTIFAVKCMLYVDKTQIGDNTEHNFVGIPNVCIFRTLKYVLLFYRSPYCRKRIIFTIII